VRSGIRYRVESHWVCAVDPVGFHSWHIIFVPLGSELVGSLVAVGFRGVRDWGWADRIFSGRESGGKIPARLASAQQWKNAFCESGRFERLVQPFAGIIGVVRRFGSSFRCVVDSAR
jgi:hypothetical protein